MRFAISLQRFKYLKHAAQLKKPFVVAAISDAAADKKRSKRRLGQDTRSEVIRKSAFIHSSVHLARFVGPDRVNFLAHERRARNKLMQITPPKQIIKASQTLIPPLSASAPTA